MRNLLTACLFILATPSLMAQNSNPAELPYAEIPEYPESYSAQNIVARMIDGLGYRFYWATEGLTDKDVNYKPSDDARSVSETIEHIYGLSETILNTPKQLPNIRPYTQVTMTFEEKRKKTLENLKEASDLFKSKEINFNKSDIVFQRGENQSAFPFWHLLNGQLADAIYHVGQIVSFRRSSGNPMNPKVNVFTGKNNL